MFRTRVLLPSFFMIILVLSMQYSGAQKVPGKIEVPNLPPSAIDENGEEPEVQGEEPEVQGEDEGPTDKGGQPEVQGQDDLTTKDDETESEEQPEPTDPRKGVEGGLDIANTTQQTLPPAFKIKITFDAVRYYDKYLSLEELDQSRSPQCVWWDMGVYVQGKLVRLHNIDKPLKVCGTNYIFLKDAQPIVVEIPGESVQSIKDLQPLSIFTAGSHISAFSNGTAWGTYPWPYSWPNPMPADLPEVRKILADKGSYADAHEQIGKIQKQVSNGCREWSGYSSTGCVVFRDAKICPWKWVNRSLATFNGLYWPPAYGKTMPANSLENPEWMQINSCRTSNPSSGFCLQFTIECPSCPAARVH
ncbi:MAG TPA: hypothetical protein VD710_03030 [Nitrososphaeraceae archaeon]|nr:hypothetical protein [Nitrososphaeraceae archaeon]